MRVLLDTTYLLPAVGVAVTAAPPDVLLRVRDRGHQTLASSVSILEVAAKGGKLVAARRLARGRLVRGLRAILADLELEVVPMHREDILIAAADLRSLHSDFLDCILLATAAAESDLFLTEDRILERMAGDERFRRIAHPASRDFAVRRAGPFLQERPERRPP